MPPKATRCVALECRPDVDPRTSPVELSAGKLLVHRRQRIVCLRSRTDEWGEQAVMKRNPQVPAKRQVQLETADPDPETIETSKGIRLYFALPEGSRVSSASH